MDGNNTVNDSSEPRTKKWSVAQKIGCAIVCIALQQTCAYFACYLPRERKKAELEAIEAAKTPEQRAAEQAQREAEQARQKAAQAEKEQKERLRPWEKAMATTASGELISVKLNILENVHMIVARQNSAWDKSSWLRDAGRYIAISLKRAEKANLLDSTDRISFMFEVILTATDKYGNTSESSVPVYIIGYDGKDLHNVNWKKISDDMLFDLADKVAFLHPEGAKMFYAYIEKDGNFERTPKLCRLIQNELRK